MKIKIATIEEVTNIAPLFNAYRMFYDQANNLAEAASFLSDRITNNDSIIFCALHNDKYIGFTQLYPTFSSVSMKKAYILNDLYVDENFRRMNVAAQLMDAAFHFAEDNGARFVALETGMDNVQAQALYEKVGMIHEQNVKHYIRYW